MIISYEWNLLEFVSIIRWFDEIHRGQIPGCLLMEKFSEPIALAIVI